MPIQTVKEIISALKRVLLEVMQEQAHPLTADLV